MDTRGGMPESPRKAAATTVVLSWCHAGEPEQGVLKPASAPALNPRGVPEGPRKARAPTRRLSVPPPPGQPAATTGASRAVRPEDDPFLAAYVACTKSTGGAREAKKGRTRWFAWTGLGLGLGGLSSCSCKRGDGAVVHNSMVRLPEVDHPRDA